MSAGELADAQPERFGAEVARLADVARTNAIPRLVRSGWVQRRRGADGIGCWDHPRRGRRLIYSLAREADGEVWGHLSVSRSDRALPTWAHLVEAFRLVAGDESLGLIIVAPESEHYTLDAGREVMHVWTCLTRRPTPDFRGPGGTI